MASKNQDVHLRIYMDANEATRSMEAITRRMGEVTDTIKRMRQQLKDNGLSKTASEADLAAKGLDRGFLTELKKLEDEQYVYKRIIKSTSTSIKDFSKLVTESAHMTRAELETTLKQIEKRFNTFHPANDKDKANMLELQHLYETVRVELERRNVKQMTGADALKVYNQAQQLMKQGALADAQALREVGVALGRAKDAQGISIAESRKYAQAQVEVNEVLKARGAVFVDTAKSAATLQNAQRLLDLSRQGKSDVSLEETAKQNATQRRVEAEKQLVQMQQAYTDGLKDLDERHEKAAQKREAHLQKEKVLQDAVNAARAGLSTTEVKNYDEYKQQAKDLELYTQRQREAGAAATHHSQLVKAQRAELANLEADIKTREEQLKNAEAAPDRDEKHVAKLTQELGDLRVQRESMKSTQATLLTEEQRLNAEYAKSQAETLAVKNNMSALEATWKNNADAVKKLQEAEKALNDFQAKGLKTGMADSTYEKKKKALEQQLQLAKDNVEAQKQAEAEAIRIYEQAVKNGGIDIATLREMYKELEFVRDHTKDEKTVNAMTNTLRDMKTRIDELSVARVNEAEVAQRAKDLIAQGGKAEVSAIKQTIEDLKILANQQGVSAENAKLYNLQIAQFESLTKSAGNAAKDLAYNEQLVTATLRNLKSAPAADLEKVMVMLKNRMRDAQTSLKDYIRASMELRQVQNAMRSLNGELKNQQDFLTKASSKLMSYMGIFGGFYLIRQKMTELFQANMKYDDSLTNIRKTTGLTAEAVGMLADNIKRIDTRTSLEDMNNLAYSAGKLGVKGVSDIMGFVKAGNILGVALGEQLGEGSEAIEQLMKITNIMGTTREFGLEEALLKTGSAINHLTMNSQATAQPMVDFMRRTAGVATQAGMTTAELTGLAGAVNALGQNVEMSATSISKMMVQISKNSAGVARALKMNAQETEDFIYRISAGDMMGALMQVLERTRDQGGLSHLSSIVKDLGGEGQRVIQTIATLSANYDTVRKMVEMSTDAFAKGTSATNEYNIKNENTAALWERIKNQFSKMMVSSDAVTFIHDIIESFTVLPKATRSIIEGFSSLKDVLETTAHWIAENTHLITALIKAMAARVIVSFIATMGSFATSVAISAANVVLFTKHVYSLGASLVTLGPKAVLASRGITSFSTAIKLALVSAKGFFNFLKSAQFGNIFTAGLAVVLTFIEKTRIATAEQRRLEEENIELLERSKNQVNEQVASVNKLVEQYRIANNDTDQRKAIIEQLNDSYGTYLNHLLNEKMSYDQIASAMAAVNEQLRVKAYLEGRDNKVEEIRRENAADERMKEKDLIKTVSEFISGDDRKAARATAADIVAHLINRNPQTGEFYANSVMGVERDDEGNVTGYRAPKLTGGRGTNVKYENFVREMDRLFQGIDHTGIAYGDVLEKMAAYFNEATETDTAVRSTIEDWQGSIDRANEKARGLFQQQSDDLWKKVGSTISQNGTLNNRLVNIDAGEAKPWIARKTELSKDPKKLKAERELVQDYIGSITQVLTNLTADGFNDEQAYNRAKIAIAQAKKENRQALQSDVQRVQNYEKYKNTELKQLNAEAYLRVLGTGQITQQPDKGAAAKARRDAKQEMDNLLQKIKDFYEIQAEEYRRMRLDEEITETQYQRFLQQNQIDQFRSLSAARKAIIGDIDAATFDAAMTAMGKKNVAGQKGVDAYQRVVDTGKDKGKTAYQAATGIGKVFWGDSQDGSATINGIRRQSDKDLTDAKEVAVKIAKEISDAWLAQNPMGKISVQYQEELEKLGLMLTDFSAEQRKVSLGMMVDENGEYVEQFYERTYTEMQHDVMNAYRTIGEAANQFVINTEDGLESFRNFLRTFTDLSEQAAKATEDDLRGIYYKAYEYAEQYEETIAKTAEKNRRMWDKMYKSTEAYKESLADLQNITATIKLADRMTQYGGSSMRAQAFRVNEKQQKYDMANGVWQNDIANAQMEVASAEALVAAGAPEAEDRLAEAKRQLEIIQQIPDEVRTAAEELNDAMMTLADTAFSFVNETLSAFEKFAEGIVPLRSWYEDKGSFVENVFGTKEERQKAFGEFMDDLKKTIIKTTQEQARLITQEAVMKAIARRKEKLAAAKAQAENLAMEQQGLTVKQGIETAKQQMSGVTKDVEVANSQQSTATRTSNDISESTTSMWGSFGAAIARAWADGGPYLGAVLAAVVSAALGSVMTMVFNMMGSSSKVSSAAGAKTKLVSGMLTYDSGNAQSFPVMGDDGRVYRVSQTQGRLQTGMVTRPMLTTVGGVPALVGERGPEMVIGRETTSAMMMSRPDLIRQIVEFDRNRSRGFAKTFDSGNVGDAAAELGVRSEELGVDGSSRGITAEQLEANTAVMAALLARLDQPIRAEFNMNGKGGAADQMAQGLLNSRRLGDLDSVKRLFGSR